LLSIPPSILSTPLCHFVSLSRQHSHDKQRTRASNTRTGALASLASRPCSQPPPVLPGLNVEALALSPASRSAPTFGPWLPFGPHTVLFLP
jgi:hypothetical protein